MTSTHVDTTTFTLQDIVCIALQRTQHLLRFPIVGSPSFLMWKEFSPALLKLEARLRRRQILDKTLAEVKREFDIISEALTGKHIGTLVDIGCGHGILDLYFGKAFDCQLHLVDIEESDDTHHGYAESGSGYASLASAKTFLTTNGIADADITLTNPKHNALDLAPASVDVVISLLSAGFHYPISTYTDVVWQGLKPGGVLIFDARDDTGQEQQLAGFSNIEVLGKFEKHKRLMVTR